VAQSQLNVLTAIGTTSPLDLPPLFRRVWDHTPQPDAAGARRLLAAVEQVTRIGSADLRQAVVSLINANYRLIIAELVKRNVLKPA
jgi:hypothetical protein